jgi:DNA-binding transcriptional MerR regulator
MYTVKQLSDLAGVTPRTLHHYHKIGLLKPTRVADNGYRCYGDEALLRLQQILLYRELDLPLADIRAIMRRHDFDPLPALESHRAALRHRAERLSRLITTVDQSILDLTGSRKMTPKDLFEGFTEYEEEKYSRKAMETYDPAIGAASHKKWKRYSAAEKQRIGAEGHAIYRDMIAVMDRAAVAAEVQAIVRRWHKHMQYFWSPSDLQLLALADGYSSNPEFLEKFEATKAGLAAYMGKAVAVYVSNRKKQGG